MIDIEALNNQLVSRGLSLQQRCDTHYQVSDPFGVLVDVWPTTGKYLEHNSRPGQKARNGSEADVVQLATRMATKAEPADDKSRRVEAHGTEQERKSGPGCIVIERSGSHFHLYTQGKFASKLTWEELLGLVASLTIGNKQPCLQWLKDAGD